MFDYFGRTKTAATNGALSGIIVCNIAGVATQTTHETPLLGELLAQKSSAIYGKCFISNALPIHTQYEYKYTDSGPMYISYYAFYQQKHTANL